MGLLSRLNELHHEQRVRARKIRRSARALGVTLLIRWQSLSSQAEAGDSLTGKAIAAHSGESWLRYPSYCKHKHLKNLIALHTVASHLRPSRCGGWLERSFDDSQLLFPNEGHKAGIAESDSGRFRS
jgi:hypothetical protein